MLRRTQCTGMWMSTNEVRMKKAFEMKTKIEISENIYMMYNVHCTVQQIHIPYNRVENFSCDFQHFTFQK